MHVTQRKIIDALRESRVKTFSVLQSNVAETSDNLTYHLQKLLDAEYVVSPSKGLYKLASKGIVYLNNNYDLENHIFPTVSCMLVLRDVEGQYLLMRKNKQPFLGAQHLLTFGVTSEALLQDQVEAFCEAYRIRVSALKYRLMYRKVATKNSAPYFDKFFVVCDGELRGFQPEVGERSFVLMNEEMMQSDTSVLSPSLEVIDALANREDFVEKIFDETE